MSEILKKLEEIELDDGSGLTEQGAATALPQAAGEAVALDVPPQADEAASAEAAAAAPASEAPASVSVGANTEGKTQPKTQDEVLNFISKKSATRRRERTLALLLLISLLASGGYFFKLRKKRAAELAKAQAEQNRALASAQPAKPPASVRYQEALEMMARGQPELAVGAFKSLETDVPKSLGVTLGLAHSLELTRRAEQAGAKFAEAQAIAPYDPIFLNNYGIHLIRNGEIEKGILLLEEAEWRDPDMGGVLLNQARAYELLNDWSEAINSYDRYLQHPKREARLIEAIQKRIHKLEPLARKQEQEQESDTDAETDEEGDSA